MFMYGVFFCVKVGFFKKSLNRVIDVMETDHFPPRTSVHLKNRSIRVRPR